jgi:serine/threonine-protein kinase
VAIGFAAFCEALQDRYRVERELGQGGMATVYLASDLKHNRPVALKVMRPELAPTLGRERFQREIELAASLQHPHILTVHDSGETAGQLWFTMPFVEGESLRSRLSRQKQLPIEDAVQIAKETAQALHYAHQHGVIHRDIKPENILLTADGSTLVADFGIARALRGNDERLTGTGLAVGTPAYMSPEQASGEPELGPTTDVYSLGAVLYEMLAGEPPFTGPTPHAILAKRLSGEAPRLRVVRPTVSPSLERAVHRALARVPADRFATTADLAKALAMATVSPGSGTTEVTRPAPVRARRRLSIGLSGVLGLAVVAGAGLLWQHNHRSDGAATAVPKRLAVLPFENLGRPEDEYFADGMTDEVRGKLASLPALTVIARASSNQYKKTTKSPAEIAKELGVQYLLTATVRWEKSGGGSRVRVSPELILASDASTRWQQPFEAAITDIFAVQGEIAGQVAEALNVVLGAKERQTLAEKLTDNIAAYDAYLKGEESSGGVPPNNPASARRAAAFYEQATALDPRFVLAWAQLSQVRSFLYYNAVPAPVEAEAARQAAERALALAPNRAEGHWALGLYYMLVSKDNLRALAELQAGQRLDPTNTALLTAAVGAEQRLGRWDSALVHLRQVQAVDPRSYTNVRRLGSTLLRLRRYREAMEAVDRGLALQPTSLDILENGAMVQLAQGDLAGARAVLKRAPQTLSPASLVAFVAQYWDLYWALDDQQQQLLLRLTPESFDDDRGSWGIALAATHALRGDQGKARAYADSARIAFEQQLQAAPQEAAQHMGLGLALAYLGRKMEAIREGERGVTLLPVAKDWVAGPYLQHQLAWIYLLVGEPEKALDQLEPLLKIPYYLSPGWLRIDPRFAPVRGNPRFERLAAGG